MHILIFNQQANQIKTGISNIQQLILSDSSNNQQARFLAISDFEWHVVAEK